MHPREAFLLVLIPQHLHYQEPTLSFSAIFRAQMASPMSKQLGDFLQEQQEPFTMEDYLHDRGYPRSNSAQFLKGSTSSATKKRRRSLPSCSKMVGAVFTRIVQSETNRKFKNCWSKRNGCAGKGNCKQDLAEDDHLSSASSSTVFNSCSEIDAEEDEGCKVREKQVLEDRKQLSPVSVLEETESSDDDVSPIHQIQETLVGRSVASQYARNRKATQQTKQLLFDCVTEVVESHRRREQSERGQRILDPEHLWKLICENIWAWSQDPIDETNVNQLVHFQFLDSEAEWRGFQQQAQKIGVIISEIMLEDIRDEIVRDMVISFK